jgi:antibiotic biosynthesis monooxygenase (ABM) superfamily enzyme
MSNNRIANHVIKILDIHKNEVTSVICRNIKPGHEKDYDNWLKRYRALQRSAPGYKSVTIIIPGGGKSSYLYIIPKFDYKGYGKIGSSK